MIHINHAKPAKFTAPDFPEPVPPVEEPRLPLGYLPAGFTHRPSEPRAPLVNHNEATMPPPAVPAVPAAPPPAAPPANQNPEPTPPCRRSPRLNPELDQAHTMLSCPQPASLTLRLNPAQQTATRCPAPTLSPLATTTPWDQEKTTFFCQPASGGSPQRPKPAPEHPETAH